jgi:cation transport regulator
MPYTKRADLPDGVKDHLPAHAQDIYKEAFNSAWDQYDHDESRAHAVAWSAVKKQYHKGEDGDWHKGASED